MAKEIIGICSICGRLIRGLATRVPTFDGGERLYHPSCHEKHQKENQEAYARLLKRYKEQGWVGTGG